MSRAAARDEVIVLSDSSSDDERRAAQPRSLRLLTWNIDGLNDSGLLPRARAVLAEVARVNPDVIFLQEIVPDHIACLREGLHRAGFEWHDGGAPRMFPYHVAIALRRSTCRMRPGSGELTAFADTAMTRHVLRVDADVGGVHVRLLTSHLESTSETTSSARRTAQFGECLIELTTSDAAFSIFGGDTNLRDAEAKQVRAQLLGGNAGLVRDAWEELGSMPATRWTWDTGINNNCGIAAAIKCRFDRVFYAGGGRATQLQLAGLQKLPPPVALHPSDHFALCCDFQIGEDGSTSTSESSSGRGSAAAAAAGPAGSGSGGSAPPAKKRKL